MTAVGLNSMTTKLSVNLNKIALIRNSRDTTIPSVVEAAITCIANGAQGITVHPRPDMRHIRPSDVYDLAKLLSRDEYRDIEFNIEGNPYAGAEDNGYPGFMKLVMDVGPDQCTLVPDDPNQLTSDHGWNLTGESNQLSPLVEELKKQNIRVSLFMDPIERQIDLAAHLGVVSTPNPKIRGENRPMGRWHPMICENTNQSSAATMVREGEGGRG